MRYNAADCRAFSVPVPKPSVLPAEPTSWFIEEIDAPYRLCAGREFCLRRRRVSIGEAGAEAACRSPTFSWFPRRHGRPRARTQRRPGRCARHAAINGRPIPAKRPADRWHDTSQLRLLALLGHAFGASFMPMGQRRRASGPLVTMPRWGLLALASTEHMPVDPAAKCGSGAPFARRVRCAAPQRLSAARQPAHDPGRRPRR